MTVQKQKETGSRIFLGSITAISGIIGIWAVTAFFAGLASANWQVTELFRQFLIATGNLHEYETLVDFYTHIKGVEYLIAVAFFAVFPVYFKYLNKSYNKA